MAKLSALKILRDTTLAQVQSEQPDLASLARELGCVVHQHAPLLRQALQPLKQSSHGFQRWLLGERKGAAPFSLLLLTWPANHATPIHDHGGLWGLELVLDGALEVDAYWRGRHDETLTLKGRDWLGFGDATWFEDGVGYVHRCRNLSRHDTALSLHVYGGDLAQYLAYEQVESASRWQATPQRSVIAGRLRA